MKEMKNSYFFIWEFDFSKETVESTIFIGFCLLNGRHDSLQGSTVVQYIESWVSSLSFDRNKLDYGNVRECLIMIYAKARKFIMNKKILQKWNDNEMVVILW